MAASAAQREGEYESQLHRERVASTRLPALDRAEQAWGGEAGVMQGGDRPDAQEEDQAVSAATRDQRNESQLQRARRQEEQQSGAEGGDEAPATPDATKLAKANPVAGAIGSAAGAARGAGNPGEDFSRNIGDNIVRQMWIFLKPSFGHTIYIILIVFVITRFSSFARKFLPQIGEEWPLSKGLGLLPGGASGVPIPIKMFEILALSLVFMLVFMFDLILIGIIAVLLALLMDLER